MSYDLYFISERAPSKDEFFSYFSRRPGFQVDASQAWYENEDTGVYFGFTYESSADDPDWKDAPDYWATFELNFLRPRFFGIEAAQELEQFVARFGRQVFDPHVDRSIEFKIDTFLRHWNHGNDFACHSPELSDCRTEEWARPADELKRVWEWNYSRSRRQDELGQDVFVPAIRFFLFEGRVCSGSIWTDGIPVVLPRTDVVLIVREQLEPRWRFSENPPIATARWRDVEPHLFGFRTEAEPVTHHYLDYRSPPSGLVRWIRGLRGTRSLKALRFDQVLDRAD